MNDLKFPLIVFFTLLIILVVNHVLFFYIFTSSGPYGSVLYNAVKFSVYFLSGYILYVRPLMMALLISFTLFFIDHLIIKLVHFYFIDRIDAFWENFDVLVGSFVFFVPIVFILGAIGRWFKKLRLSK